MCSLDKIDSTLMPGSFFSGCYIEYSDTVVPQNNAENDTVDDSIDDIIIIAPHCKK